MIESKLQFFTKFCFDENRRGFTSRVFEFSCFLHRTLAPNSITGQKFGTENVDNVTYACLPLKSRLNKPVKEGNKEVKTWSETFCVTKFWLKFFKMLSKGRNGFILKFQDDFFWWSLVILWSRATCLHPKRAWMNFLWKLKKKNLQNGGGVFFVWELVVCIFCQISTNNLFVFLFVGLSKLIADNAGGALREKDIKNYFGRKIAIDASMSLYQFLVCCFGSNFIQFFLKSLTQKRILSDA